MGIWWAIAGAGALVIAVAIGALVLKRRALRRGASYIELTEDATGTDDLLRSQVAIGLDPPTPRRRDGLEQLRQWAAGTADVTASVEELARELRTLQTYVLDLDDRYIKREEAAWLSVQVVAIVLGITAGVVTVVWAVVELAS